MSNLGYMFYRDYYNPEEIDLRQFAGKKDNKKENEINVKKLSTHDDKGLPITSSKGSQLINRTVDFEINEFFAPHGFTEPCFQLKTTYPGMLIGSGYNHAIGTKGEFKIGFFFDYTTGLPILPGSSFKGVLRSVFPGFDKNSLLPTKLRELNIEDSLDTNSTEKYIKTKTQTAKADLIYKLFFGKGEVDYSLVHRLEQRIFENHDMSDDSTDASFVRKHECFVFFDAILSPANGKRAFLAEGNITPHGDNPLISPIPLSFLKIQPDVIWDFYIKMPEEVFISKDFTFKKKDLIEKFKAIVETIGMGAKTNVGFGQLVGIDEVLEVPAALPRDYNNQKKVSNDSREQRRNRGQAPKEDRVPINKSTDDLVLEKMKKALAQKEKTVKRYRSSDKFYAVLLKVEGKRFYFSSEAFTEEVDVYIEENNFNKLKNLKEEAVIGKTYELGFSQFQKKSKSVRARVAFFKALN